MPIILTPKDPYVIYAIWPFLMIDCIFVFFDLTITLLLVLIQLDKGAIPDCFWYYSMATPLVHKRAKQQG